MLTLRPALLPVLLAATLAGAPLAAFAAGSSDSSEPKKTETTQKCEKGQVWDEKTKACVPIKKSELDDDTLYADARELAYAGRYEDALAVLDHMTEKDSDRVLTYKGFATRKMGDMARGLAYYHEALDINPNNFLARSYLGQAYVQMGRVDEAKAELQQIAERGGADGWPYKVLEATIKTGKVAEF